ncbi:MAG: hypothetical protein UH850_00565 [Paludibacteraceae bacterium]|nr:hypothetical protein [Paludibacteraceae bacterium]
MLDVKTIEVAGFLSAVEALRLPFGKECRSQTNYDDSWVEDIVPNFQSDVRVFFDERDLTLMSTLIKRGDEHAKVLRGIIAYAEINAPRFWWVEMDTYRIGSERLSSESTMHIQGRGMSTEELVKMKSELTEGTMQKRVQYFSYQALRRIYQQRRNHRLPHWHIFCDWIKTLPFANELILIGLDDCDGKEDKR